MTARAAFNPATGTFTSSPNGTFAYQARGNFVTTVGLGEFNRLDRAAARMAFMMSPYYNTWLYNQAVLNGYNLYSPYNPYLNPYAFGYAGYAAPAYTNPYLAAVPSGYAAPSFGYAPMPENNAVPAYAGNTAPTKQRSALAAFGIPNDGGSVRWPLAFRLVSPEVKRDVLDILEAQLQIATTQALSDKANPAVLTQASRNLEILKQWARSHRLDLAEGTYLEAQAFLYNVDQALRTMRTAS